MTSAQTSVRDLHGPTRSYIWLGGSQYPTSDQLPKPAANIVSVLTNASAPHLVSLILSNSHHWSPSCRSLMLVTVRHDGIWMPTYAIAELLDRRKNSPNPQVVSYPNGGSHPTTATTVWGTQQAPYWRPQSRSRYASAGSAEIEILAREATQSRSNENTVVKSP